MNKSFDQKNINRVYQYSNGAYLPDSSQPNKDNYDIVSTQYTPHISTRYMNVIIGDNGLAKLATTSGDYEDTDKPLPELYIKRAGCCGCAACYSICPCKAIDMLPDEEGFLYPVINAALCIRCYKCVGVCPIKE